MATQPDSGSRPLYLDSTRPVDARLDDLLQRMSLEQKAAQLFHNQVVMPEDFSYQKGDENYKLVGEKLLSHLNLVGHISDPEQVAEFVNKIQSHAKSTQLGIPITFSTDPRHSFTRNVGTGFTAGAFSQWPETLGLAALRDPGLVQTFADVVRQEYLAVGLRCALHPQIDLATEPRWARNSGTWGEDANLTSDLVVAYIKGLQGAEISSSSVTTITKHFPGGGPQEDGEDAHFTYGKNQIYPGNHFVYHLLPFKAAIAAGTRQMMPYYSQPVGTEYEQVGFAFNRQIITELLREKLGFDGIVVTDWGLLTDEMIEGQDMPARAWGMEDKSPLERLVRILDAGCDQLGGEARPELVVEAVERGLVTESRIDISVRRILKEKMTLGLFDSPFLDTSAAKRIVGNPVFKSLGNDAQRRSFTLLTNKNSILPLGETVSKVYAEGIDEHVLRARGLTVVLHPEEADVALLRYDAPYQPRPGGFERMFHAGSLEFSTEEKQRQKAIYSAVPSIVDIKVDRPSVVPEIADQATALLVNYGSDPDAFLDVVFGVSSPQGKLPFDLPRSDAAVKASREDVPFDTKDPVFRFGHGLSYNSSHVS